LIAASLLRDDTVGIVALVRPGVALAAFIEPIRAELEAQGGRFEAEYLDRIRLVELPPVEAFASLDKVVRESGADEIVHCAGCLDYFDRAALETVNIALTRALLEQSRRWGLRRFVYLSTAFSSGYIDGPVREVLHDEAANDPTDYTRTKRLAERLVAASGIPFLIIRPSIVIGDSRDGHYSGKRYGLYQLWSGIERLLCREWHPEIHALGARQPVVLVHQDAFQNAFLAAFRLLPDDSIFNLVSARDSSPTMRQLWDLWMRDVLRPRATYYYDRMADIPLRKLNSRQRALLALASVNLEIASHPWQFETTTLGWLRQRGLHFLDATFESVAVCQRLFVDSSEPIQAFFDANRQQLADRSEAFDVDVPIGP